MPDKKHTIEIGNLRASFRHNSPNHKKTYPRSRVILLISVGQKYHEREKLEATIDLINRSNFKECTIMLGDYIQRHNLCINIYNNWDAAGLRAQLLGDEWLERNQRIYSKLKVPYKISRWQTWLTHPDYQKHRADVDYWYNNDDAFQKSFHHSIEQFINRYKKKLNHEEEMDVKRAFDLCLEYLLEECSIIMPLWAKDSYDFIIYPSNMLPAMQATYEALVKPHHPNILKWLSLRFKRKSCTTID